MLEVALAVVVVDLEEEEVVVVVEAEVVVEVEIAEEVDDGKVMNFPHFNKKKWFLKLRNFIIRKKKLNKLEDRHNVLHL